MDLRPSTLHPASAPAIAPMTPDDLDEIMLLERVCFSDPWTRRMYLMDLTQNELATYLVVRLPLADQRISESADQRIRHSLFAIRYSPIR